MSKCRDCFWYNNETLYYDPNCSCAYFKKVCMPKEPRIIHLDYMIEPEKCDKYISDDDAERILRIVVDERTKS